MRLIHYIRTYVPLKSCNLEFKITKFSRVCLIMYLLILTVKIYLVSKISDRLQIDQKHLQQLTVHNT